jgi:hypothetical protein
MAQVAVKGQDSGEVARDGHANPAAFGIITCWIDCGVAARG